MQYQKKVQVTTSWDDGHVLDIRLGTLLKKYAVAGTFYVCPEDREFSQSELLSKGAVYELSEQFEIGGHTIHHPHLSKIPLLKADEEIRDAKKYLEDITLKRVTSFCYPYGDYSEEVKKLVIKNGYLTARTTLRFAFSPGSDLFAVPTTFHMYQHYSDLHKIFAFSKFSLHTARKNWEWEELAMRLFDAVFEKGGVFHLWGHSWEIEKYHNWEKLEMVLSYISQRENVSYLTNSEVISAN